ncbi:hypothetical protein [Ornithinimicrobium tianjinense]|uniref:Lipoprotein LprG n=1 Tax=Ornithinimicrobium tianjinense TaxID=1195761 RepID=A0A917BH99_9MICO|nr:hypothetical protein [Ornithinimicrobium tianjinense]GGF39045.1 hypothetical protein GCM10011366_03290 [Ornithinimicrobium tianjinense]
MTTTRTRLASVLGAGALVLALGACSDDSGTDAGAPTSGESTSAQPTAPEVAEGEEVDIAEFVAMMKSPGEEKLSSYTMTMNMKTGGEDLTMEGAVDVSGEDPALDLDMAVPGAGKMQMRMVDGRLFMAMPGITPEGKFMEVPPEQLGDTASALEEVDITSQMDTWEQAARKVVYVGEEDVDGTTMRHYSVTVDSAAAMDAAGVTGGDAAAASSAMGEEFVYEVWLDDDNLMRKLAFDMEGTITEMFADNWGEPQDIQAPPAEDIVDGIGGDADSDSETSDG